MECVSRVPVCEIAYLMGISHKKHRISNDTLNYLT